MPWVSLGPRWYSGAPQLSATASAGGTALVRTPAVPGAQQWVVDAISIATTSSLAGDAVVCLGDPSTSSFICGTNAGNNDSADGSPITIAEGQYISIGWTGQTPGAKCAANVHYDPQAYSQPRSDSTVLDSFPAAGR